MGRYHGGRWIHFLVCLTLTSKILVSSSSLPTIHQDIIEGEDDDNVDPQSSDVPSNLASSFFIGGKAGSPVESPDASPDAQPALPLPDSFKKNTKESKEFRSKFRRIKSPVRRRNRIMLLLKSEMGKVQIAIEDLKDDCHRKRMTQMECERQKIALGLQGKLRRIQSAYLSVENLGMEAEQIQDMEVQAQKDLQNATQYHHKAKTMLSGRMVALEDVEKRIGELKQEDQKNSVLQSRWEENLKEGWARMNTANEAQRVVEGYNIKLNSKLKGILDGLDVADHKAAEDWETANAMDRKAELVEAHAKLLEDKADRIIEEGEAKTHDKASGASEDSTVQYQSNKDGILASDSAFPLDSFGESRAHPQFGMQNFMAERKPLLVGKQPLGKQDSEDTNADDSNDDEYDVVN